MTTGIKKTLGASPVAVAAREPIVGSRPAVAAALKYAYFLAIAGMLPIQPQGLPFNTIPFDYANILLMALCGLSLLFHRRLDIHLVWPWWIIFLGSLVAMLNSTSVSTSLLTLVQEVYLIAFFLVLSNVIETEKDVRALVFLWSAMAAAYAVPVALELREDITLRARGTFGDDNGAGAYLAISCFLALHPLFRRRPAWTAAYLLVLLAGAFASKSLSASLSLTAGALAVAALYLGTARWGKRVRFAVGALAVALVAAAIFPRAFGVHNFLDRLPHSYGGRAVLWRTGLETFLHNPLGIGIGPGRFKEEVVIFEGPFELGSPKELHSDYLSFLVERGVLGFAGLLFLLGAIGSKLRSAWRHARDELERRWVLGLCGMFAFVLVDAVSHEVMHYRHLWVAFALVVAQERLLRARVQPGPPRRGA